MTDDQLRREAVFIATVEAFRAMHARGIITGKILADLERRMAEKYMPPVSVLSLTN